MSLESLFVLFVLLSVAYSHSPVLVSECGILNKPFTTYQLAQDIVVQNMTYAHVCFNIIGKGITLDGKGFGLSSATNTILQATGVQYSGENVVVRNLHITNMRTGIHAKGKYGEVYDNTITRAINGIDVSATNNNIRNNVISQFDASDESTAGIYVYFPATTEVDSFTKITNNVISDIRGDTFALGISVYYANAVVVANNVIFNLQGGVSSKEISVINGKIESFDNSFIPPTVEGGYMKVAATVASLFCLLASYIFFSSPSPSSLPPTSLSLSSSSLSLSSSSLSPSVRESETKREEESVEEEESERRREEEMAKEMEGEEYEMDGADVVRIR